MQPVEGQFGGVGVEMSIVGAHRRQAAGSNHVPGREIEGDAEQEVVTVMPQRPEEAYVVGDVLEHVDAQHYIRAGLSLEGVGAEEGVGGVVGIWA